MTEEGKVGEKKGNLGLKWRENSQNLRGGGAKIEGEGPKIPPQNGGRKGEGLRPEMTSWGCGQTKPHLLQFIHTLIKT